MRRPSLREEVGKPDLSAVIEHYGGRVYSTAGRLMVTCIFHEDRTPSMSVDLEKQVVNCHSCGFGGDAWTIIEKKEACDFRGAIEVSTALGLASGVAGGSDKDVYEPAFTGGGRVAHGKRDRKERGTWRPSWSSG